MATNRRRLDQELVRRELAESAEHARSYIDAGQVLVNGSLAQKPATMVAPRDAVELTGPPPKFVGRGGDKLASALADFSIDPTGHRAIDVGSSTGGFTDALLQGGAVSVVAVDVGRAQLHERLRGDDRVTVAEQTDIRSVDPVAIGAPFNLVVVDVSFIGLERILDQLAELMGPAGTLIALVKPQFEAGRAEADRARGVIRDPEIWRRVLDQSVQAVRQRGLVVGGVTVSPVKGGAGNVEFFIHGGGPQAALSDTATSSDIDHAIEAAAALP